MRIIEFDVSHINKANMRQDEIELISKLDNYEAYIQKMKEVTNSWTVLKDDGSVWFCFGISHFEPGYADLWMLPANDFKVNSFKFGRCAKKTMSKIFENNPNYIFRSYCEDKKMYDSWMKFLGFKKIETKTAFGMFGEPYNVWERC